MLRILNAEPENYSPAARTILDRLGTVTDGPLLRPELIARLPDFDVLIVRLGHQVDREVLDHGPRLKAIVSATTGLDHIDTAFAGEKGIAVLSLRGETEFLRSVPATAELTWALLLALVRNLPGAFQSVLNGEWNRDRFKGHDLAGKRLGILGLGRIGEKVARYGLAFGMKVIAYDPFRSGWMDGVEKAATLPDLLAQSDVLSVHIPLNEQTVRLVTAAELACLPAGAVLVNTSRGPVLAEPALLAALESGRLAGAALDVLAGERAAPAQSPLLAYARTHSNLVLTPHIGGATYESMAATEIFMARKLQTFLEQENLL